MRTPIDPRYFLIKYILEFFVVVLGISVSFSLSEWNDERKSSLYNIEDSINLLDDLEHDKVQLDLVMYEIILGKAKSLRLLRNIELYRDGIMEYEAFVDSIIDIGYVYTYTTFFMNNATYKSLIHSGRIKDFPSDIEKDIKDYYEYVSKRVLDNNRLVDNTALDYYHNNHPICFRIKNKSLPLTQEELRELFYHEDMRENYSNLNFYKTSLGLSSRISAHGSQTQVYIQIRNRVDSLLRDHVGMDIVQD